jgi:hypothetical protein
MWTEKGIKASPTKFRVRLAQQLAQGGRSVVAKWVRQGTWPHILRLKLVEVAAHCVPRSAGTSH